MKKILKIIAVPIIGFLSTFILCTIFFTPPKLYNYNLIGRMFGFEIITVGPLIFIVGCLLALLFLWKDSPKIKKRTPLLIIISALIAIMIFINIPKRWPLFPHNQSLVVRHRWATHHLNPYYSIAIEKIKQQETILNDAGKNLKIAPVPHSKNGMYDGWVELTLDVKGEKGQGRCEIVYRHYSSKPHNFTRLQWLFNNKSADLISEK